MPPLHVLARACKGGKVHSNFISVYINHFIDHACLNHALSYETGKKIGN